MRTFRDTADREWDVAITVGTLARVLDSTGVDLTKIFDEGCVTERALDNVSTLFAVICAVVQPQLSARGISPSAFGDSLDEAAAEAATLAVYEGVIDFFRGPKRAMLLPAFQRFTAAARKVRDEATEKATAILSSVDFEKAAKAAVGNSSRGNSPERSASNHPGERFAS